MMLERYTAKGPGVLDEDEVWEQARRNWERMRAAWMIADDEFLGWMSDS
jgi:hypothetical protein